MIDISNKIKTLRTASAQSILKLKNETIKLIQENKIPKGNPFEVAKVAAVMSAKNTNQIIPYCHPLPIDFVGVKFEIGNGEIKIFAEVKAIYKTGVEMEAITAASIAAITVYDMTKMFDETMQIVEIKLLQKTGGKSDFKDKFLKKISAAVVVMSDSIASGKKSDLSGKIIVERLKKENVEVCDYKIIPDEKKMIEKILKDFCDKKKYNLIVTTGGTGLTSRDITVEAMQNVIEKEVVGISEAIRNFGQERTPYSMLSRGISGVRKKTLIINLPGSKRGVSESLDAIFPNILHIFKMLENGNHPQQERKEKYI